MKNTNKLWVGLIIGILFPIVVFLLMATLLIRRPLSEIFDFARNMALINPIIALSAIFNLAFFYFFLNRKQFNAARGVILATILYAIAVVWIKFF